MAEVARRPAAGSIGLVLNRRGLDRAIAAGCDEITRRRGRLRRAGAEEPGRRHRRPDRRLAGDRRDARAAGPGHDGHPRRRVRLPVRRRGADRAGARGRPRRARRRPRRARDRRHHRRRRPAQVTAIVSGLRALDADDPAARALPQHPQHRLRQRARRGRVRRDRARRLAGGIGGCPFAPGATGNIATEDLLYLFERSGIDDRRRPRASIAATGTWISELVGYPQAPPCSAAPAPSPTKAESARLAGNASSRRSGRRGTQLRRLGVGQRAEVPST